MTLDEQITKVFSGMKVPNGKLSAWPYNDEGAHDFFTGTKWGDHNVKELRTHESALCFFTPEAFRYYLPAFMLAEVREPEIADIIAEDLASCFIDGIDKENRTALFNKEQIKTIISFFECCAARYDDRIYDVEFNKAKNQLQKVHSNT